MHIIGAKAVCFGEALKPEFKEYQKQVLKNAQALAQAMMEEGFNLVSGGTDNHLMLVDLQNMNITGKELQNRLDGYISPLIRMPYPMTRPARSLPAASGSEPRP